MILVDSSVWIDYFNGVVTPQTDRLNEELTVSSVAIGDLILTEVLQGFADECDFRDAMRVLAIPHFVQIGGRTVAEAAAGHYRSLRRRGITIRKTIDTLIASYCILHDVPLLFDDRDFVPFVTHRGLRSVITPAASP